MSDQSFHLGFCMAGSVSAGAYTAGVLDYLIEALRAWEAAKKDPANTSIPKHDLKIDLLCGTSGGGISAAMALFAIQDSKLEHCRLNEDRKTYNKVKNNIFWNSWVEMSGDDIFYQMLATGDLEKGYVPSGLNASFIDKIAENFEKYVLQLAKEGATHPRYLCDEAELFLTLFNVTGIRYSLFTKAASSSGQQYVSEHRDISHFGWHNDYKKDLGRMELTLEKKNLDKHLKVLINSAKATGAFPGGLKGRKIAREAKYIWENPFFNYDGKFTKEHIHLGKCVDEKKGSTLYLSINADGGTANNEPIELAQDVMTSIRANHYKQDKADCLTNSTVILIDPFPSLGGMVTRPKYRSEHLTTHLGKVVGAMRSQLLFDAKRALDAYKKTNYGLHLIAPSRDGIENQEHAIACGALGGFGGFLHKEFRVHDYFLGRHNCQSFLRKYLVVNLEETGDDAKMVSTILESYKNNPAAVERFKFVRDKITWVPILPEVSVTCPADIVKKVGEEHTYDLAKRDEDFLEQFRDGLQDRYSSLLNNILVGPWWQNLLVRAGARLTRKKAINAVIDFIGDDLKTRELMHGTPKDKSETEENCSDMSPFDGMN